MDYVIAYGNISDGLTFYGPYTAEEMYDGENPVVYFFADWADDAWTVVPLEPKPTLS